MRAIAREAGVGIATLYRHFPTRESLVDAVYHDQVERLTVGARELLDQLPPAEAMRGWMDLFGDWLMTKHGMIDTLLAMIESGEIALAQTRAELLDVITTILDGRPRGRRPPPRRHRRGHRRQPDRHLHRGRQTRAAPAGRPAAEPAHGRPETPRAREHHPPGMMRERPSGLILVWLCALES